MNSDLNQLHPYPFEKLAALFASVNAPADKNLIRLSIGEPKHPAPQFVLDEINQQMRQIEVYPSTRGCDDLRTAISQWLEQRFSLEKVCSENQVLPVNGTREAIFSFVQAAINRTKNAGEEKGSVITPNPFYQIYEGAALLAGAQLHYLPCDKENDFIADFSQVSPQQWSNCQLLFLCTPGNPTGAVISLTTLKELIALADKHDFIIASDECYSEIYTNESEKPVGLLEACASIGRHNYHRCVVFHSLSKRSNLPGLRSGFIAGDAELLKPYLLYRTYHGCAMSMPTQLASIKAWQDESHVEENRRLYKEKFTAVLAILKDTPLEVEQSDASFYLWPRTPICDEQFAQRLYAEQGVVVLPGSYLSRTIRNTQTGEEHNPGKHYIRMALVAPLNECIEAAQRIKTFCASLAKNT